MDFGLSNRPLKPHAYTRALHLVGWRHGLFELKPLPLLTLFFWYAPTNLGGLMAAGKRDSFGSCTDSWLNLSARHIRYWIPARTHLPKNLWRHSLAHPCYPVHVPLMVGLGYGATRDLANGCWYSTEGGYPECPQLPRWFRGGPAKSVKTADCADCLVKRARCVVIFSHRNPMHRTRIHSGSRN